MRSVVVGGAGFIGYHLTTALTKAGDTVVIYDRKNGDYVQNTDRLIEACRGADRIYHLASNADIAASAKDPTIDFYEGTFLTQQVLEAARIARVPEFVYASGSGVYGEHEGFQPAIGDDDDEGNIEPISTYGASKLAGEALVSAYCHMFGMCGQSFRFANVVGAGQTHGVGYDFIRKLRADPSRLEIFGDGEQTKHYLHVSDAISAMTSVPFDATYQVFNVAPIDCLTVTQIANMAVAALGGGDVEYRYTGGDRGWVGDVPVVYMHCNRLEARGWKARYLSEEAMPLALEALANEHR